MDYTTARRQVNDLKPEQVNNFISTLFWAEDQLTMNQKKVNIVNLMIEYDLTIGDLTTESENINQFQNNWR